MLCSPGTCAYNRRKRIYIDPRFPDECTTQRSCRLAIFLPIVENEQLPPPFFRLPKESTTNYIKKHDRDLNRALVSYVHLQLAVLVAISELVSSLFPTLSPTFNTDVLPSWSRARMRSRQRTHKSSARRTNPHTDVGPPSKIHFRPEDEIMAVRRPPYANAETSFQTPLRWPAL